MKIAFIGLGAMGGHMAKNVVRNLPDDDYLEVFDVDRDKVESVEGATPGDSVREVAGESRFVILSLPTSEIVEEVVSGSEGVAGVVSKGAVVIDTSTTSPEVTSRVAKHLSSAGGEFLDAPVSGGVAGARDANLAIMVGGNKTTFAKSKHILEMVGSSVVHVGETGSGEVAKLVNNMIVGSTFCAVAEGFALGKKMGLDLELLYEAIKGGWARSPILDASAQGIARREYEPNGGMKILFKDLGYATELARSINLPTPVTSTAENLFKAARAAGYVDSAHHAVYEVWGSLLDQSDHSSDRQD